MLLVPKNFGFAHFVWS